MVDGESKTPKNPQSWANERVLLLAFVCLVAGAAIPAAFNLLEKAGAITRVGSKSYALLAYLLLFFVGWELGRPALVTALSRWALLGCMAALALRRSLDLTRGLSIFENTPILGPDAVNYALQKIAAVSGLSLLLTVVYSLSAIRRPESGSMTAVDSPPHGVWTPTPPRLAYARLVLAAIALVAVAGTISVSLDLAERSGWLARATRDLTELIVAALLSAAALIHVRRPASEIRAAKLLLLPLAAWLTNRLLNFTEEVTSLDAVPILGRDGALHQEFGDLFLLAAGAVMLAALYWLAVSLDRTTADLGRGKEQLRREVALRNRAVEERDRAEEALRRSQRLESLGLLAGGVAHDFNNLLMAITGFVDLALEELPREHPARERLGHAYEAAFRAAELSSRLLTYTGKAPRVVEEIDLSALVDDMNPLLDVAASKTAPVERRLAPDLPLIEADATQIRQVVLNLVTNASEATRSANAGIRLRTGAETLAPSRIVRLYDTPDLSPGNYAFVEVADQGSGMDPATIEKIFDPFYSTKPTGRGLGLAAVHGIVRAHRGGLEVESEPGRGSKFRAYFPAAAEGQRSAAHGSEERSVAVGGAGVILVVDDEEIVRNVTVRMLRRAGYEPIEANDGLEALEMVESRADVVAVVLDLVMPRLDGPEALARMRRIRTSLPVVVTTGYGEKDMTFRIDDSGPLAFLQKPYSSEALMSALRKVKTHGRERGRAEGAGA